MNFLEYLIFSYKRPVDSDEIKRKREFLRRKKMDEHELNNNNSNYNNDSNDKSLTESNKIKEIQNDQNDHYFMAFARIFSGTLKKGQNVFKVFYQSFTHFFFLNIL
jgi:hypothetical protein